MSKKTLRNICIGLPVLLLAYLGIVALWSLAVVDQVVGAYPPALYAGALAPQQQAILLKVEDPTFFEHGGVSLANGQGVTTVTSSLAREAFLFHSELPGFKGALQTFYRAVFNCCRKVDLGRDVMAFVLDRHLGKQQQLALYAREVYMGRAGGKQVKGLEQASAVYLGKPLAQASAAEFAGLVGMIQAPNLYNPLSNRPAYDQRAARVAAVASGSCVPDGWFDTSFEHCAR
jgi:membrane carboxypeptidase/penicillin-binding protein